MNKFSIRRLLLLAVTVLPVQLMAQSGVAERIGSGNSPVMTPISGSSAVTHFAMPETYTGPSDIRSSFTPVAAPVSQAKRMIIKAPGANINMVGDVVYSESLAKGFYTVPVAEGGSFEALNNTFGSLPANNFGSVAIDGVYYVA